MEDIRKFFKKRKEEAMTTQDKDVSNNSCSISPKIQKIDASFFPNSNSCEQQNNPDRILNTALVRPICSEKYNSEDSVPSTIQSRCFNESGPLLENKQRNFDLGDYICKPKSLLTNNEKYELIVNPWKPDVDYKFSVHREGSESRSFQYKWLSQFPWLCYSQSCEGALCKYCVIFAKSKSHNSSVGNLITKPQVKWKKALEVFRKHEKTSLHSDSVKCAEEFRKIYENKGSDVIEAANSALSRVITENRLKLSSIVETIILCGKQNIPFRGHREGRNADVLNADLDFNDGCFRSLLRFRINSGDEILKKHFETAPRNAIYISPTVQNDLINIAGCIVTEEIIKEVKMSPYFSILADETTDISGIEQMSFCIRYLKDSDITENFIKFTPLTSTTGEVLADTLLDIINSFNLNLEKLRGQGYDGAANMSGKFKGVKSRILEKYPLACYTHCYNHSLNLVITESSKVVSIRNMVDTVKTVTNFIRESRLRRDIFSSLCESNTECTISKDGRNFKINQLKKMCETRWTERHSALLDFVTLFDTILETLEKINESDSKASPLISAITTFEFIASLKIAELFCGLLLPISKSLQSRKTDLIKANQEILSLKTIVQSYRKESELKFTELYVEILKLSESNGIEESIPRICRVQTNRCNIPADNAKDYYRKKIFIPFLDHLLCELNDRFDLNFEKMVNVQILIPRFLSSVSLEDVRKIVKNILEPDVNKTFLEYEIVRWKEKWSSISTEKLPDTAAAALSACDKEFYPNIRKLFEVLCVLPVTTAEAERSFSSLRRLKTWLRSTTSACRLNGLAALYVHYERNVSVDEIINRYANSGKRRLELLFK